MNTKPKLLAQLKEIEGVLGKKTPDAAQKAKDALNELGDADPNFKKFTDQITPLIDAFIRLAAEAKKSSDEMVKAFSLGTQTDNVSDFVRQKAQEKAALLTERNEEAAQSEFDRKLEQKTDEVVEAFEKLGQTITRAAAKSQAFSELMAGQTISAAAGGGSSIETARQFIGLNENEDADVLSSLFKQAGQNVDPKMVAWCAAFVNAVLATNGISGTGSLSAKSFLNFGTPTEDPQKGDVVVLSREGGGHVGFFEGKDEKGNIRVLGGNQGDGVGIDSFSPESVLGFRQIPGSDSAITSAANASDVARDAAEAAAEATLKLKESKDAIIDSVNREIEALGIEARSFGQSTFAAEKAAQVFDLTNQFIAAGHEITPELTKDIDAWAASLANAAVQAEGAEEKNRLFEESQQEVADKAIAQADAIRDLSSDVLGGLASDLANGVKPAEALANALQKVAEKLLDIGINALTSGLFGPQGTPLGGLFGGSAGISSQAMAAISGGVLGGLFHKGGVVGAGGPSRMVPASAFIGAPRYHSGGVAGFKPGEMPAILQKGELVIPKLMASKGGAGARNFNFTARVDLAGANGDAAIEAAARRGTMETIGIVRQNVGGWLAEDRNRVGRNG